MIDPLSWRRIGLVTVVVLLLGSAGTTAALAQDGGGTDDAVEIASQDFTIRDAVVTVGGGELAGPGLPDAHIEERTYTISGTTMTVDGLTVDWNDTTYEICHITVTVDEVGITVQDLTLENTA